MTSDASTIPRRPILAFLHLPKTTGTSFSDLIFSEYHDGSRTNSHGGALQSGVLYTDKLSYPEGFFSTDALAVRRSIKQAAEGTDIRAIIGHFSYGVHVLVDVPVDDLTLLRDSVERVISLVAHLRQWRYDWLSDNPVYAPYLRIAQSTGDDFLCIAEDHALPEFSNDQTRRCLGRSIGFAAKPEDHARVFETIRSRLTAIGLTERFEASVRRIAQDLQWTTPLFFPESDSTGISLQCLHNSAYRTFSPRQATRSVRGMRRAASWTTRRAPSPTRSTPKMTCCSGIRPDPGQ